jgi:hypothetical protein
MIWLLFLVVLGIYFILILLPEKRTFLEGVVLLFFTTLLESLIVLMVVLGCTY